MSRRRPLNIVTSRKTVGHARTSLRGTGGLLHHTPWVSMTRSRYNGIHYNIIDHLMIYNDK